MSNPDYTLFVAIDTNKLQAQMKQMEQMFNNASKKLSGSSVLSGGNNTSRSDTTANRILKVQEDIAQFQRKIYAAQTMRDFKSMDSLTREVKDLNTKIGKLNSGVSAGSSAIKVLPSAGGSPLAETSSKETITPIGVQFDKINNQIEELNIKIGKLNTGVSTGIGNKRAVPLAGGSPLAETQAREQQQSSTTSIGVNYGEQKPSGIFSRLTSLFDKIPQMLSRSGIESGAGKGLQIGNLVGSLSKNTMALVGIGAGIGTLVGLIVESSPILKSVLRLMQTSVMLILRPIGDFIGTMLRPIMLVILQQFIIPYFRYVYPITQKLGAEFGANIADFFKDPLKKLRGLLVNAFVINWGDMNKGNQPERTDDGKPGTGGSGIDVQGIKDKFGQSAADLAEQFKESADRAKDVSKNSDYIAEKYHEIFGNVSNTTESSGSSARQVAENTDYINQKYKEIFHTTSDSAQQATNTNKNWIDIFGASTNSAQKSNDILTTINQSAQSAKSFSVKIDDSLSQANSNAGQVSSNSKGMADESTKWILDAGVIGGGLVAIGKTIADTGSQAISKLKGLADSIPNSFVFGQQYFGIPQANAMSMPNNNNNNNSAINVSAITTQYDAAAGALAQQFASSTFSAPHTNVGTSGVNYSTNTIQGSGGSEYAGQSFQFGSFKVKFANGGVIKEPSAIIGLKTGGVGLMAEKGPEAIVRNGGGIGGQPIHIENHYHFNGVSANDQTAIQRAIDQATPKLIQTIKEAIKGTNVRAGLM